MPAAVVAAVGVEVGLELELVFEFPIVVSAREPNSG